MHEQTSVTHLNGRDGGGSSGHRSGGSSSSSGGGLLGSVVGALGGHGSLGGELGHGLLAVGEGLLVLGGRGHCCGVVFFAGGARGGRKSNASRVTSLNGIANTG